MLLDLNEIPKVALEKMNKVHEQEVKILNNLYEAINEYQERNSSLEKIEKLFEDFYLDVLNHFSFEQKMMEEFNFFAFPVHKAEHDMILAQLRTLKLKWEKEKNPLLVKSYIEKEFLPWLMNHIQTMDTITAHFLTHFIKD